MKMLWSDLEVGDKVKISKETLTIRHWRSYLKDEIFVIKEISFEFGYAYVKCESIRGNDLRFVINAETGASRSYDHENVPLFKIIELKED